MLEHQHLIVRATVLDPITSVEVINKWLIDLVDKIDMKILMGPFSTYCETEGNEGITATCIIETSHIAIHIWDRDLPPLIQLAVYSCAPVDLDVVFAHLGVMKPQNLSYQFLDRNHNVKFVKGEDLSF